MKVTVREVAKAAKVSVGTVSRVLNGHQSVSPDAVDRVHMAVSSMKYKKLRQREPQSQSGSLEGKCIAMVLLGMDRSLESLPSVAAAIQSSESALVSQGATALLVSVPNPEQLPTVLRRERLDGLILKGALQGNLRAACSSELLSRVDELPSVWFLGRPAGFGGDVVNSNDTRIGELAAQYLASRGHRNVAFLNPKPDHMLMQIRQMSFEWNAQKLGMEVRRYLGETHLETNFPLKPIQGPERVQRLVDNLLASPNPPTAVFVPADSIAVMVYRALAERGLRVGEDLSVISCNHEIPLLCGLYPSLTSIAVHAYEVGQRAVAQLSDRLFGVAAKGSVELQLEPDLVEGDSVTLLEKEGP
jgi:LacI family transcriptional regulator